MSAVPIWRKFNSYSGALVRSGIPIEAPTKAASHVDRAYWLTAKVETGATWGTVMNYDGTGMTAGPDQHIAVYPKQASTEDSNPKNDQGSLWSMLNRLLTEVPPGDAEFDAARDTMRRSFANMGWVLDKDGLHYTADSSRVINGKTFSVKRGDLVFAYEIRNTLSPDNGAVPQEGPKWEQTAMWAMLFHRIFVHPRGRIIQLDFGKNDLITRTTKKSIRRPEGLVSIESLLYPGSSLFGFEGAKHHEHDLAACVFHAHTVNAPAISKGVLDRTPPIVDEIDFARALIRGLGLSEYGLWNWKLKNGRYARTREVALASGLWSADLFTGPNAVMPPTL